MDRTNGADLERALTVFAFRDSLNIETDRGCALMAAAFLSEQLFILLVSSLVRDDDVSQKLLSSRIESFCDRIDLAFALGLLPPLARRDLHLIRRIRNEFAHDASPLSFASSQIADRCRELYYTVKAGEATPRQHFTSAAMSVCGVIHGHTALNTHPSIPHDTVVNDEFKREVQHNVDASASEDDEAFVSRLMENTRASIDRLISTQGSTSSGDGI